MRNILYKPKLRLFRIRDKLVYQDNFENGLDGWSIEGNWHKMTVDTNVDESAGLDGDLAINCAGSYSGGVMKKKITLKTYGEIYFNHYVQNPEEKTSPNCLKFYIDNILQLEVKGATPWQACEPMGLSPGEHEIKFEYIVKDELGKKGVVDNIRIFEGIEVNCLITKYTPPRPAKNITQNKILRGFTRFQEMQESDTEIEFSVAFSDMEFLDFQRNHDKIYYFIDEFGVCYRGLFATTYEPDKVALNSVYVIGLKLVASQKLGVGFIC